jgi:hypothetical protein
MMKKNDCDKATRRRLIREVAGVLPRGSHRHAEHDLQASCMTWLRYTYPEVWGVTFAVPNGGRRDAATAGLLRAEGVKAGVADIVCLWHGVLCIEMKTRSGRQSPEQRTFQKAVQATGGEYVICRSLDEFRDVMDAWVDRIEQV